MALFQPGCQEAYEQVFSDSDPSDWCVLGYDGKKLVSAGVGTGGLGGLMANFDESKIFYGLLRMEKTDDGGDSKRIKFIFITWVGENAPALKKGQVNIHKAEVGNLFKGFHIEKQLFESVPVEELQAEIEDLLKKAGGANYDLGNSRSGVKAGASSSVKASSKQFFEQKDKETEVQNAVYEQHISKSKNVTACDLGGRAMTAASSEAKKNTVGYDAPAEADK
mmetsp:Transcript_29083/g.35322  ORF Transcript_29083/g.35322 Transcript_29083/m.35322 type:complete len:222 (+) Transcript_29083:105-770(+)